MVEKYSDDDFESLLGKYDYNFKRGDIAHTRCHPERSRGIHAPI